MKKHASTSGRGPAMPIIEIGGKRLSRHLDVTYDLLRTAELALLNEEEQVNGDTFMISCAIRVAMDRIFDASELVTKAEYEQGLTAEDAGVPNG